MHAWVGMVPTQEQHGSRVILVTVMCVSYQYFCYTKMKRWDSDRLGGQRFVAGN